MQHDEGIHHRIQAGQCTFSLSAAVGVPWHKTWYHPANAELRRKREAPGILLPGDSLFVPSPERKQVPANTEKRHRFVARQPKAELRIVLRDLGEPLAGLSYHARVDRAVIPGVTSVTDDEGLAIVRVPAQAERATLVLGATAEDEQAEDDLDREEIELMIGTVGPVHARTGQAARLINLDLLEDDEDDALPEAMTEFLAHVSEGSRCPDVQARRLESEYGS